MFSLGNIPHTVYENTALWVPQFQLRAGIAMDILNTPYTEEETTNKICLKLTQGHIIDILIF
jgi:hypothetical protein